jgi:cytochrome P450
MRDILDVWDRLLRTAMLLSFNFPVPDALVPGWRDYRSSLKRLDAILDAVLADREREQQERRKKRRDQAGGADAAEGESAAAEDLLSALLRGRRERPELFSDASVRSTLHLFLFAGSDTTASLLSFLFYELSRRPDAQARCAAEARAAVARSAREQRAPPPPSSSSSSQGQPQAQQQPPQQPQQQHAYSPARVPFLTACMNETLRLYPPGTDTARRAAADLDVGGFFVPKDSLLLLNNYSLHRHERYWPRPGEWLPERWIPAEAAAAGLAPDGFPPAGSSDTFQPFGVGARACVGRLFAMLEAAVLASNVLAAYELSPGDADVALLQKFTLSSEQGVFVRARRRAAAQEDEGASSSSPSSPSSSSSSVTAR